ncbi:hypothetical protein C2E25_07365 [Geothermobacter hydrogeniphilus]|uniref:Uncharacterized protein n=1 Tax=Geothermobacter hydrogeniphilus TaxID=1969733 RepID=A0A2K2HAN1_9BACT|nr:hypothetical protein [Geothermobacter hydrogeniphilus]PNU20375.1 hypothetical protein C2E25_07365 [Geothermobacter hydrogeniphilus]
MSDHPISDRLFLIGTVHRDRYGEERLSRILEQLRPGLVTVEMSPYARDYRTGQTRPQLLRLERILKRLAKELGCPLQQLNRHPAIADIRGLLALPFEYRAARAYADADGADLKLVDLSEVSIPKLRQVETGLISYRNLKILVRRPTGVPPSGNEGYAGARQLLAEDAPESLRRTFLRNRRGTEGIGPRDAAMAEKIVELLQRRPEQRLVHIGGWVHLIDDPQQQTLYSHLAAWRPQRLLLGSR